MKIHGVTLTDFRGISHKNITFQDEGITIVSGPNQSGKSSVIEAIGLVLTEQATSKKKKIRRVLKRDTDRPAVVDIDVTIGDEHLQLEKKFGVGRASETVLTFPESGKQPLHGSAAHDYVQDLLNEHEDTALFDALQFLQEEALDSFRLTSNQSALQTALDAAADRQYDDDGALLNAVEEKYAEYFTPTGRENKNFTKQRETVTKLGKEVESIEAQVSRVQEESRTVEELSNSTAKIRQSYQESLTELEAIRATVGEQDTRAAEIKELSEEENTLSKQLGAVTQLVRTHDDKQQRIQQLKERIQQLKQQLAELPDSDVAELKVQKAELAELDKQFRLESDRATVARLVKQHDDLLTRKKKLEEYHQRVEDLQLRLSQSSHNEETYAEAQRIVDRIAQLDAASLLSTTSACIQPLRGPVRVAGEEIAEETTLQVSEDLSIEVPEIVKIILKPGEDAAKLHTERVDMEKKLTQKLTQLGTNTWDEAVSQRTEWLQQHEELTQLEIECRAHSELGDLDAVNLELSKCEQALSDFDSELCGEARDTENTYLSADELQAMHTRLQTRTAELEEKERTNRDIEQQQRTTTALIESIAEELQTIHIDEELVAQHRQEKKDLSERCTRLHKKLALLKENFVSSEEIHKKYEQVENKTTQLKDELAKSEQQLLRARAQLEVRLSEGYTGQLQEAEAEYDVANARLAEVEKEAAAVALLRTTLEEARSESAQYYQRPYIDILHRLGRKVWGESFQVTVDDDLQIATAITKKDSQPLDYEDLSAGTKEQLAVLSRLACFYLVDRGAVPVMLDDVLGYSDPERLDSMVETLRLVAEPESSDSSDQANSPGQIFIFTCAPERFADIPAHRVHM